MNNMFTAIISATDSRSYIQVEKNLDVYKSLYDIVLVDHATFSVPLAIVRYILRQTESPETVTPVQVTDPPGC